LKLLNQPEIAVDLRREYLGSGMFQLFVPGIVRCNSQQVRPQDITEKHV